MVGFVQHGIAGLASRIINLDETSVNSTSTATNRQGFLYSHRARKIKTKEKPAHKHMTLVGMMGMPEYARPAMVKDGIQIIPAVAGHNAKSFPGMVRDIAASLQEKYPPGAAGGYPKWLEQPSHHGLPHSGYCRQLW